ncbi:glutathione peroxidase [Roseisalinus antarcticus]|uniref:Glutathione peroxidase n=1 Tax=Roseisalinus antarcticus TaxID=254357 RepID=A0A1Y5SRM7_9RHOB|nr:glutathione peroxidase [Roseisalinus antarcticus]SLN46634.1 Hydroperoxy fatty acid reductase gpx1 [Roseisalinus antarcticus]
MVSHIRRRLIAVLAAAVCAPAAFGATGAVVPDAPFPSIDGGEISLAEFRGRPVLLVNTASLCAFTPQYEGLQAMWERYRDAGLVVLAVPSDDFRQELSSDAEVKDFCALTFGLDLPMTTISSVRGPQAHPVYRWLAGQGVVPGWNFHKVLIGRDGTVLGQWPASVRPMSAPVTRAVEAALAD